MTDRDSHSKPGVALFQSREIRRTLHNDEWWFVITDIIAVLTDAADPSDYWKKMRRRDPALGLDSQGGGQIVPPLGLAFETAGGQQKLQCWNTQGIFRLIQSIPSPKAEPFKRWLAKVGKERLDEIENPELAMGRMQDLYEKKGYPKEWIDKRLRGIAVRQGFTSAIARSLMRRKRRSIVSLENRDSGMVACSNSHCRTLLLTSERVP
jgi:prophage antirepressor-like protein